MAKPTRLPLMAGNWKLNLNHHEAVMTVQKLAWTLADKKYDPTRSEAVVLASFTNLRSVQTLVDGDKLPLRYGAQDVSTHDSGAYTGEVSAAMLDPTWVATNNPHAAPANASPMRSRTWAALLARNCIIVTHRVRRIKPGYYSAARKC